MKSVKDRKLAEKVRITIDLTPQFYERLEELEELVEADTKASLVRQALQLYEFIAKKAAKGYRFRLVGPDGTEENLVLFEFRQTTESTV